MEKINFAFAGYDIFLDGFAALLDQGHTFSHASIYHKAEEPYASYKRLLRLASDHEADISFKKITDDYLDALEAKGVNVLISAGYGFRIPVTRSRELKIINIHPTDLPEGKGPWPLPHLILKGIRNSAITYHKLSPEFDSGDSLFKEKYSLSENETIESLTAKIQIANVKGLPKLFSNFDANWSNATPQAEAGSYWKDFEWDDRVIDWKCSVVEIEKLVRAFGKFCTGAAFDGQDWIVHDVDVWFEEHNFEPGTVVVRAAQEITIAATDGFVVLTHYAPDPD